jgi:hypothetical protein
MQMTALIHGDKLRRRSLGRVLANSSEQSARQLFETPAERFMAFFASG